MPTVTRTMICPDCNQCGQIPVFYSFEQMNGVLGLVKSDKMETCPRCDGTGRVPSTESLLQSILTALLPEGDYCKHCLEEEGISVSVCEEHRHVDNDE